MGPILYIDCGDHNLVIADYSGSARHRALTEAQWEAEYRADPSYAQIRATNPTAIPAVRAASVGPWKKDWSGPYVLETYRLAAVSTAPADFDGVPVVDANGEAVHTMTVRKVDQDGKLVSGEESIRLIPSFPIKVLTSVRLSGGEVTVEVGPSALPCDVELRLEDPLGKIEGGKIRVRFK